MFSTTAVGIDINESQVNLVALKRSLLGIKTVAFDKFFVDSGKGFSEQSGDIADFINKFLKTHSIAAADIFVGIPVDRWIFRQLDFPLVVKENLASTLSYEMEKYVPMAADEVYFDYQVIAENKDKEIISVSLAVAKKYDIDPYLKFAENLSATVSGVTTGLAGVVNSFIKHSPRIEDYHIIVFPDSASRAMVVIRKNALIYARSFKREKNEQGQGDGELIQGIADGVRRFRIGDDPVCGSVHSRGEESGDIYQQLRQIEGLSVSDPVRPIDELPESGYIPAYGLALQAIGDAPISINLMPAHLRKKPNRTPYYIMYVFIFLLISGTLFWAGINTVRQYRYLNELEDQLTVVRKESAEVEALRSKIEDLKARINQLKSLRPGNAYITDVLLELTRIFPETSWIRDLNISGNNVILYGYAESASNLIPILEDSPLFHQAEFLSTIRKTGDGKEVFRIGLKFWHEEK